MAVANRFVLLCALLCLDLVGCGGSRLEPKAASRTLQAEDPTLLGVGDSTFAPPMESVSVPITHLEREDVVATVDAGLGRFLQKFEMEASLTERGEFAGFRIVRVFDKAAFQGLGLGPGDIVTSVNQRPIERPTEAYEAFVSLRTAESLDIDYLRGGRLMRLSLPILEDPTKTGAKSASTEKKGRAGSESKRSTPPATSPAPQTGD